MLQRGDSDIGWADLYIIPDRARLPLFKRSSQKIANAVHSDCQSLTHNVMIRVSQFVKSLCVYNSSAVVWRRWNQNVTDWLTYWLTDKFTCWLGQLKRKQRFVPGQGHHHLVPASQDHWLHGPVRHWVRLLHAYQAPTFASVAGLCHSTAAAGVVKTFLKLILSPILQGMACNAAVPGDCDGNVRPVDQAQVEQRSKICFHWQWVIL